MSSYGKFCPVSMGAEVIADRWTPLILRELILGSTRFNDIARGLPGISRSLLVQRLKHLERKGVLDRWPSANGHSEYHLTPAGKDLENVVFALGEWSVHWLFNEMEPREIDPVTLTWWMHHRIDADQLPPGRVVVQIDYTAPQRVSLWIVLDRSYASVCKQHPGFEVEVIITCTTGDLAEVFNGFTSWGRAMSSGAVRVDGAPRFVRAIPRWFRPSPFAPAVQARARSARSTTGVPTTPRARPRG